MSSFGLAQCRHAPGTLKSTHPRITQTRTPKEMKAQSTGCGLYLHRFQPPKKQNDEEENARRMTNVLHGALASSMPNASPPPESEVITGSQSQKSATSSPCTSLLRTRAASCQNWVNSSTPCTATSRTLLLSQKRSSPLRNANNSKLHSLDTSSQCYLTVQSIVEV